MGKKISVLLMSLMVMSACAYAAPDVSSTPIVQVSHMEKIDKVLEKPTMEQKSVASMDWYKTSSSDKIKNVYMSVIMDEKKLGKIPDSENLVYEITELVDEAFIGSELETIPFVRLSEAARNKADLLSMMSNYDAAISIFVEKQDKGEIILRCFLEEADTQKSFGDYTARVLYDKKDYNSKRQAFQTALRGFVKEIRLYNNGQVTEMGKYKISKL